MKRYANFVLMFVAPAGLALTLLSCKRDEPVTPATPSLAPLAVAPTTAPGPVSPTATLPPGHPPIGDAATAQATPPKDDVHAGVPGMPGLPHADAERTFLDAAPTRFAGISLTPSAEWRAFDPGNNPMGPVAAFLLPAAEGAEGAAEVRLTHYPGMKNIPLEMNLDRWYGMVVQPDGKPTKDVARLETFDAGGAHITVADMSGSISGVANQRMIAAAIEHEQGPHFLKVTGPEATVAQWRDSVIAYLKSAKVEP